VKEEEKRKEITIEINEINLVKNHLVFSYMKNIQKIVFHAKPLTYEAKKAVREAMKYLEGYEITNETDTTIEVSFLFSDVNITVPKILQRMLHLLKLEVDALKEGDEATMDDAEAALDRLYYLSIRILFSCLRDYSARERNGIKHDEDLFFINNIAKRMEAASDQIWRLRSSKLSKMELSYVETLVSIMAKTISGGGKSSEIKKELKSVLTRSKNPQTNAVFQKLYDFCKDVIEARINIEFNDSL
jgi:hypothetical protein